MPKLVQRMFPKRVWAFSDKNNTVYLTFDDGPIPEVTPWVLSLLKEHNAKATFFCIGENITKHPDIFERIISEGHSFGNHTFHHLNGWKTETLDYLKDCELFEEAISKVDPKMMKSPLFRPPYGRLNSKQSRQIQNKGYKIIMWDVLSYDYNSNVSEEKCLQNVLKAIQPGSIVVFHDSLKAANNMKYALPKLLKFIENKGWKCEAI
ncbi:polysaccharide deacetylase family protein [Ulvibacter antarcticus]|nr:polysaccharide deacetylase family protein [Ulvibacter antarcticus]